MTFATIRTRISHRSKRSMEQGGRCIISTDPLFVNSRLFQDYIIVLLPCMSVFPIRLSYDSPHLYLLPSLSWCSLCFVLAFLSSCSSLWSFSIIPRGSHSNSGL